MIEVIVMKEKGFQWAGFVLVCYFSSSKRKLANEFRFGYKRKYVVRTTKYGNSEILSGRNEVLRRSV